MKVFSLLFFFLLSQLCFAQNLVPNPSFEDTVACPTGGGQVNLATGWSSYAHTPDYCNSCNTSFIGIPSNQWGYQYPRTGNAYTGLICYMSIVSNLREYIGIQLNQSLSIGQEYFVSFYVAMSFNVQGQRFGIAADKIGVRLSTTGYSSSNPIPTTNYAHIYSNSIISDTVNWTKVSGYFIADSAYNYLSIGNFFQDSFTSYIVLDTSAWYSYYYIDDICLSTDSLECYFTTEGIPEQNDNLPILLFPNPAHDRIEIKGNEIQSLVLFDILGRTVYQNNYKIISPLKINTSGFPRGIYLIKAKTKNKTLIQKIILH
jgi:hypothetical protein